MVFLVLKTLAPLQNCWLCNLNVTVVTDTCLLKWGTIFLDVTA